MKVLISRLSRLFFLKSYFEWSGRSNFFTFKVLAIPKLSYTNWTKIRSGEVFFFKKLKNDLESLEIKIFKNLESLDFKTFKTLVFLQS